MDQEITILILTIVAAVVLVFIGIYFLGKRIIAAKKIKTGKNGEKTVKRALEKIARKSSNRYKVINDLYLPLYDVTTQIDHVVIGKFGVVVVETKALNGEIYGTRQDENWTHIAGDKRNYFYNPLNQNQAHIDCIKHIFKKENIFRVNVDSLVVFSQKTVMLNIPRGLPVISLSLLKKYFKKSRYKQDNGVDVDRVYETLMKYRVTDKEKIKQHNENVKKMAQGKYQKNS